MNDIIKILLSKNIINSAAVLLIAIAACIVLKKVLKKYTYEGSDEIGKKTSLVQSAYEIIKYIIIIIALLKVLQINGIDVGAVFASFGIASAIVGLALQDALKDIIMGLHIKADKFFTVGDVVCYNGDEHIVIMHNARTTKLQSTSDMSVTSLCNRDISKITLASSMTNIDIPAAYEEDVNKVHSVLEATAQNIKKIDGIENCKYLGTQNFGDSAILYRLRFFCSPAERPAMRRAVIKEIQNSFNEAKITIPYNKLDIYNH